MNYNSILFAFVSIYYTISISYVYCSFLNPKDSVKHPQIVCMLITLPTVFLALIYTDKLSFIIAVCMLFALFVFKDSWGRRIAGFVIAYSLQLVGEFIAVTLSYIITYFISGESQYFRVFPTSSPVRVTSTIFFIITIGLLLLTIMVPLLRNEFRYLHIKTFAMLGFPIIASMFLYNILTYVTNNKYFPIYLILCCVTCSILYLPLKLGFRDMYRQELDRSNLENQRQLMEQQLSYSHQLEEEYRELRKWNHDIDNHFLSLSYLLENQNFDDCKSYLETLLDIEEGEPFP